MRVVPVLLNQTCGTGHPKRVNESFHANRFAECELVISVQEAAIVRQNVDNVANELVSL